MKQLTCLILMALLAGLGSDLFAQQSRFDEANERLEQSDYREAIQLYKSIAGDGYYSGALWLNMGYAYSRIDSLGVSKYYLMKAEKHSETRQLAREALDYVNDRFTRRSAVLPALPWDRFLQSVSENIGVRTLVISGLLLLYGGIALVIGSWFRYDLRQLLRYGGYSLLSVTALIFLLAIVVNYQDNRYGTGVVVDRQATVYQQPATESSVVSTAYEGYTMRVDFKRSEDEYSWKYIRLENGMFGWIQSERLMVL